MNKRRRTLTADHVIVAAGSWGTQNLLHRQLSDGHLPNMSPRLGHLTRTNSEAILGAMRPTLDPEADYSEGLAITSSAPKPLSESRFENKVLQVTPAPQIKEAVSPRTESEAETTPIPLIPLTT